VESLQYVEQWDTQKWILEKYDLYKSMLFRIAFSYLGNKRDSMDILQEAFIKLYYTAPVFPSEDDLKRWIIRITIKLSKNHLRSVWNRTRIDLRDIDEYATSQEDQENLLDFVYLPMKYKAVLYLYYFEEYKVVEIANILKLSVPAIKMRLKRGRELLKLDMDMKVDQYREIMFLIDTGLAADEKIKHIILNCLNSKKDKNTDKDKSTDKFNNNHTIISLKTSSQVFSSFSVVWQALPALTFLIILICSIVSVRNYLIKETEEININNEIISTDFKENETTMLDTTVKPEPETSEDFKDNDLEASDYIVIEATFADNPEDTKGITTEVVDIADDAADSEDLSCFSWSGYTDTMNDTTQITDIVFEFSGLQNSFYLSDLTEFKIALNNKEISFLLIDKVIRYYGVTNDNSEYTRFSLKLNKALTEPGTYIISGKYQGKLFTYWKKIINQ
jgi:RNA polymerase sigma-70 factor (ECF subfamily)